MTDPIVSVIIPVYNDPEGIADTLSSLRTQTYDEYEVLAVDNGSTDGGATASTISRIVTATSKVRHLEESDTQGSYAARNKGIKNARGEFLFFLDSDMTVEETWIEDCVERMKHTGALYAGCNITFTDRNRALETVAGRYELAFGFPSKWYLKEDHFVVTAGLLTRYELFDRIGLFDSTLFSGGDNEFGERVYAAGIEQHYFDEINVYHPPRTTVREHWNKSVRVGRGLAERERNGSYSFDRELNDPILYLPNAWPWNARDQLTGGLGGHDPTGWPRSTVAGIYAMLYLVQLGAIVGRLREQYHSSVGY